MQYKKLTEKMLFSIFILVYLITQTTSSPWSNS